MMKYILFITFIGISFVFTSFSLANADSINAEPEGWHWYNEEVSPPEEDSEPVDPLTQMQTENQATLRALYTARKNPTKENVKHYMEMQQQVVGEANKFSRVWASVLLDSPELNYSLKHPTNNYARKIEEDEVHKKEELAIHALSKVSGLFFFYRSSCPYCRAFAPTVKQFAEMYGIKVIPITTDGIVLPEFPDSRVNQGQAEAFEVKVEPALFAVNPYTHKAFPIAYGLVSLSDLKRRILDLATQYEEEVKK